MGYLKKSGDGNLLYSVVNTAEPDADGGWSSQGCFLLRAFIEPSCYSNLYSYSVILKPFNLFVISPFPGVCDTGGKV